MHVKLYDVSKMCLIDINVAYSLFAHCENVVVFEVF
jgi:hypothetical protein